MCLLVDPSGWERLTEPQAGGREACIWPDLHVTLQVTCRCSEPRLFVYSPGLMRTNVDSI